MIQNICMGIRLNKVISFMRTSKIVIYVPADGRIREEAGVLDDFIEMT